MADKIYKELVDKIFNEGDWVENRTGIDTISIFGETVRFDLRDGFPILTTRRVPFKSAMVELEGFIKGITDKRWFEERGCKYWSYWCNPQKVPYANDDETKAKMMAEPDLGPIYGSQWTNFKPSKAYIDLGQFSGGYRDVDFGVDGINQLEILVNKLKQKKDDRRLIVTAWNPLALDSMALVPCHYLFICHISPCGTYLDLRWSQRSVDVPLGLPSNIISYAALLTLLAHEAKLIPRYLIGNLDNCHIYRNQVDLVSEQVWWKKSHDLPKFKLKDWMFNDIFDWTHDACELIDYKHSGVMKYPIAAI
jgi:thymidylate synthase